MNTKTRRAACVAAMAAIACLLYIGCAFCARPATALGGTATISDLTGVSREAFVGQLEAHENDDYYLGTVYKWDWIGNEYETGPWWCNGNHPYESKAWDSSTNTGYGMNCGGFVARVLCDAGGEDSDFMQSWYAAHDWHWAGPGGFRKVAIAQGCEYYTFASLDAMLASGVLEKGDILIIDASQTSGDSHMLIFWGDEPNQNLAWHSIFDKGSSTQGSNRISDIYGKSTGTYYVFKYENAGSIDVQKASANPSISDGNPCYSLAGAVFGVYDDAACTSQVATIETDANGYGIVGDIRAGNYWVREVSAPSGYAACDDVMAVTVKPGETARAQVTDGVVPNVPQNRPADVVVRKLDAESQEAAPLGKASLAGAEFTVCFYAGNYTAETLPSAPTRSWVLKTDATGTTGLSLAQNDPASYLASGDELYLSLDGTATFPLGTVTVQETKASAGYKIDPTLHVMSIAPTGSGETQTSYEVPIALQQVKRGDIELVKADERSMERMANVPFLVTSATTGEAHVAVTDENGQFKSAASWNLHTANTNGNDAAASVAAGGYAVDETALDAASGIWFGQAQSGAITPANNALGALPYDDYLIQELPCAANDGHDLVSISVSISRDATTVDLGTVDDTSLYLSTTAVDEATRSHQATAREDACIIDTVLYSNLVSGQEYVLKGSLIDVQTGEAYVDATGAAVMAEVAFSPAQTVGSVEVAFEFDGSELENRRLVAFEELWQDGTCIARHADLSDEGQTVTYAVELATQAVDEASGTHTGSAQDRTTIVDAISYRGLVPGAEYTVSGTLMDKESGNEYIDGRGQAVTASKTFTPEACDGSVELAFEFDGSNLQNVTLVAFEKLQREGRDVAAHASIDDEAQSVAYPVKVSTTASLAETGGQTGTGSAKVVVADEVAFTGLDTDVEYTMCGTLMDKASGEAYIDAAGNAATASVTFTPQANDGTVRIEFAFDGSNLENAELVAFERLLQGDKEIASHEDLNDSGQTIRFAPTCSTCALDVATQAHVGTPAKKAAIVDTIAYQGLVPGKAYTTMGKLHVRNADGTDGGVLLDADGTEVVASTQFTPTGTDGSVEVEFSFDGSLLQNVTLVAFEEIVCDGQAVAAHADIADEEQAVRYEASIATTATDAASGTHEGVAADQVTLVDEVAYVGLATDGRSYTLHGTLMDKEDKVPLRDASGNTVEASIEFVPETACGTIALSFTWEPAEDAFTAVAFEELTCAEEAVAAHADLEDEGQTVCYAPSDGAETATARSSLPKTGDILPHVLPAIVAATAAGVALLARRRRAQAARKRIRALLLME